MLSRTAFSCLRLSRSSLPLFHFSSGKPSPLTSVPLDNLTTNHYISKNVGLNRFMQRVYTTTGLSILGALGTSSLLLSLPLTAAVYSQLAIGGFVASLVGLIGSSYMKPTYLYHQEQLNNK